MLLTPTGKENIRLAIGHCTGSENSILQCPLEDWWRYDKPNHYTKREPSDKTGGSMTWGTGSDVTWWEFFESGVSVVNIQCHNVVDAAMPSIYEDLCAG